MENDHSIDKINKKKRKRSNKDGSNLIDTFQMNNKSNNIRPKNPFLSKRAQTLQCNKEIFDTLSDVSTDDSDIQIVHESSPMTSKIPNKLQKTDKKSVVELDSDSDSEHVVQSFSKSMDYLVSEPNCDIVQEIDYIKFDSHTSQRSDRSNCSSDSSDSDHEVIRLDDDVSFVIDGVPLVDMTAPRADSRADGAGATADGGLVKNKRKRKSQKRFPDNPDLRNDSRMFKYWSQRYDLFERFDMGIKLDKESWYSVTAEYIAKEQASLCRETDTVLDGFCGAGGNTIQFAYQCKNVIALDIDSVKVDLARNNCAVYGVDMEKVSVTKNDFYRFAEQYESSRDPVSIVSMPAIDVVFLSPPWGGQDYLKTTDSDQSNLSDFIDIEKLIASARKFHSKTIMLYLPRNTDEARLQAFVQPNETMTVVHHQSRYKKANNKKVKAITVVYKCE